MNLNLVDLEHLQNFWWSGAIFAESRASESLPDMHIQVLVVPQGLACRWANAPNTRFAACRCNLQE